MSYKVGSAVCDACQHEWVAVLEGGDDETPLECPNCGEMKGRFLWQVAGDGDVRQVRTVDEELLDNENPISHTR